MFQPIVPDALMKQSSQTNVFWGFFFFPAALIRTHFWLAIYAKQGPRELRQSAEKVRPRVNLKKCQSFGLFQRKLFC